MNGKQLKNSILQWAIQGKLVPQDPSDEPASVLLERIRKEKARLVKEAKLKKQKNESIIFRGDDNSHYEKFIATGEVKCIDDEIPFEIPESWEWTRISTISLYVTDGDHQAPPKAEKGIPFVVISDISQGQKTIETTRYVPEKYFDALPSERKPRKGDILFSVTGSYGIAVENTFDVDFCFQRHIALIRPFIWSKFLCLIMQSPLVQTQCDNTATGMAQKTVGLESLRSFLLPIPPLAEQKRIVARIEELLPLIERYSDAQDKLDKLNASINEALKKSILQEAIQGKLVPQIESEGTAQELLEQIKAEKQRLVKEGKLKKSALTDSVIVRGDDNRHYEKIGKTTRPIDDEIPFEIPESWSYTRLGEIGDWGSGSTPAKSNSEYYNGNVLWLRTGELNNGVVYDTEYKITEKALKECSFRINQIGDVLIAMYGATIGKLAIAGKVMTTNQACCGCTPIMVYNKYLFYFLMASRDDLCKRGEGGAQPNISREKIVKYLMPLPPLSEQHRIVERTEELLEHIFR